MPRRGKQSDLEILFELLFDIGRVLVEAILSIFRGMFGLFNSNKTNFNIDWDEEVRKNLPLIHQVKVTTNTSISNRVNLRF